MADMTSLTLEQSGMPPPNIHPSSTSLSPLFPSAPASLFLIPAARTDELSAQPLCVCVCVCVCVCACVRAGGCVCVYVCVHL